MNKKKSLLFKLAAVMSCFVIMVTAIPSITAQAATANALSLKYKGKTVKIFDGPADDSEWENVKQTTYAKIKKAFGKPNKVTSSPYGTSDKLTVYKYKADGFTFEFRRYDSAKNEAFSLNGITIKITSTKAALNGIKVGMSYDKVLKQLEKNYSKSLITTQKNKKKITLLILGDLPVEYTFKDGKVSKINFFCS